MVSGTINGMIQLDQVSRSTLPGYLLTKLLAILGSVCLVLAVGYLLLQMLLASVSIVFSLLPAVLVLGVLLYILRAAFVGFGPRNKGSRQSPSRPPELIGRILLGLLRGAASIIGRGVATGPAPGSAVAEVRRFRIVSADGFPIDCELLGHVRGPALRQGDGVQVFGRLQRNGTVRVRRVVLDRTGGCVTVRLPLSFVATRVIALAGLAAAGVIVAAAASYYA